VEIAGDTENGVSEEIRTVLDIKILEVVFSNVKMAG